MAETGPIQAGRIEAAAKREAAAAQPQVDIDSSEPDFSSIPSDEVETYAKRLFLKSLHRQGIEDKLMLDLRIQYADKIFNLVTKWLLVVVFLILCSAISFPQRDSFLVALKNISFHLPDAVLIAFITTTTINVIALFAIVANWLFPKNPRSNSNAKPPKD
jgi:hypothetical protein